MNNKLLKVSILCFILAFVVDLIILEGFSVYKAKELVVRDTIDIEKFQKMNISGENLNEVLNYCSEEGLDYGDYLACVMMDNNYEIDGLEKDLSIYNDGEQNKTLASFYHIVMDDILCFPVLYEDENRIYYSDTFLAERNYGGERKHMGTDIIDGEDIEGDLEIISMTDGVVENIGWLELGGYRVGIRSDSGAYFYYAHLDRYEEGLEHGDEVNAGDTIGYMGSTGYGEEGTYGEFVVHLHFGIFIEIGGEEVWVNPYSILDMLEKQQ